MTIQLPISIILPFTILQFQCCGQRYACHKYILSSRSSYFSKLITELEKTPNETSSNSGDVHSADTHDDSDSDDSYRDLPGYYSTHTSSQQQKLPELKADSDVKTLKFILEFIYTNNINTEILFGPGMVCLSCLSFILFGNRIVLCFWQYWVYS